VDLSADDRAATPQRLADARAALSRLACPSVALRYDAPSPTGARLLDGFDVVVASESELQPVLDAVRRTPLAAMALVQLLRHNARLDVHEGLVAESLVYSTLQGGPEFAAWRAKREKETRTEARRRAARGPAVLAQREGGCVRLTLNRPEKHNAFSSEMRDALAESLQLVVCDPSIEAVVLSGAGPSFCSGGDLDEFGTFPDAATAHAIRCTRSAPRLLSACAERVRAEVHGACVGAGIELPAFARRVVATEDAFFQLPEVGMGLVPGAGGTASIPRRIGRQRAAYLALSGMRLDAATALEWGLVDDLVAATT
jgi:enoyl-CoA hydratase/carnithine racemase